MKILKKALATLLLIISSFCILAYAWVTLRDMSNLLIDVWSAPPDVNVERFKILLDSGYLGRFVETFFVANVIAPLFVLAFFAILLRWSFKHLFGKNSGEESSDK